jgi:hypothetical protein
MTDKRPLNDDGPRKTRNEGEVVAEMFPPEKFYGSTWTEARGKISDALKAAQEKGWQEVSRILATERDDFGKRETEMMVQLKEKDDQLKGLSGVCTIHGNVPACLSCALQFADLEADRDRWADSACRLESQLKETERERDLAIAHDRQPYPTAEAYERVCATLHKKESALAQSEEKGRRLVEALRYWMPDETMVTPPHKAAWYEHVRLLEAFHPQPRRSGGEK